MERAVTGDFGHGLQESNTPHSRRGRRLDFPLLFFGMCVSLVPETFLGASFQSPSQGCTPHYTVHFFLMILFIYF